MFDFFSVDLYLLLWSLWSAVVYLLFVSGSGYLLIKALDAYRVSRLRRRVAGKVVIENTGGREALIGAEIVAASIVVSESLFESLLLLLRGWIGGESPHRLMRRNHYLDLLELRLKEQAVQAGCSRITNVRYYSSDIAPRFPTPVGEKGLLELFVVGMASP